MPTNNNKPVAGWIGGFMQSNADFAYPNPNLSALPMLDNMANIDKLQRQQPVKWPEFSWESAPGEADPKRCYQMFAPYISRLGYTDKGRVFSIICPQQGMYSEHFGVLNVEVTVTGQRGWVDEPSKTMAADMSVIGKVWFSPSALQKQHVADLMAYFVANKLHFPFDKANAIRVNTSLPGNPQQPIFPLRSGESSDFPIPEFARHTAEAWDVSHLGVQIGAIEPTGNSVVDEFNQLVMDIFNLGSGNMLKQGNVLTWNVWFTPPTTVNQEEWRTHAQRWRDSIDADHGSPDGPSSPARYFDGTPFKPLENLLEQESQKIEDFLRKHVR